MVKGELITLYSYVWEPILRDNLGGKDLIEFARKLPELRKALSCSVCTQLLTNRVVLCPTKCRKHFVCDGCKGKKRDDNNKCGACEDWGSFKEDETLYLLLQNYQDFCYYVLTTEDIVRLLEVKHEVDPTFDTFKLIELVSEGVKGSALLKKRKLLPIPNAERDRGVTPHNVNSLKRNKKARLGDNNETTTTPTASVPKQTVATPATIDNSSKKPEGLAQVPQNKAPVLDKREKCLPQIQTPAAEKTLPRAASIPAVVSTISATNFVSNVVTKPVSSAEKVVGSKPQLQLPVSLVGKMGTVQPSAAPPPPVKVGISKVLSSPMIQKTVSIRNLTPLQAPTLDKTATATGKITPVTAASLKVTTTKMVSSANKNVPIKTATQSYISVQGPNKVPQQPTLPTERVIAVSKVQVQPLPSSSTQSTAPISVFPPPPKVVIADKPTVFAVSTGAKASPCRPQVQPPPVINTPTGMRTPNTSPSGEKLTSVRVVPLPISTVEKVSSNRPQVLVSTTPVNKSIPSKPPVPPSPSRPVVVESPKQQLPKVTCVTTVGTGVPVSGSKYIQIKVEPQQQMYLSKATSEVPTTSSISNLLTNDLISKSLMPEGSANQQQIEQILPHSPIKSSPSTPTSSKPPVVPVATAPINVNSLPFTLSQNHLTSSGQPQFIQISHQGGVRTLSIRPQQVRLTGNVTFQGRTVPVHIIGPPPTSEALKQQIAQQLARRKLIPSSEATDIQQPWPDQPKIIHLNASEFCRLHPGFGQATIRSNPVNVGPVSTASSTTTASFTSVNVRPVANSGSLVRPTTTSTSVSNVTSLANALNTMKTTTVYTQPSSSVQISRAAPTSATSLGATIIRTDGVTTLRQVQPPPPPTSTSSSATATSAATTTATSKRKQEGCRCGNATPNPGSGKLTCIGQRCACYADGNACSDCKCKGCKNPYLPGAGGKKVLHHGMRTVMEPQTSQSVPFVSSMAGGLTNATMMPSVTSTATNVSLASNVNFGPIQAGPSGTVQLIPLRFGQPGLGQYIQIANAHGLQQLPVQQIFFNGASLPSSATGITIQGLSGIHQMAQIQQQRPPLQMGMHMKPGDRNPNDGI